MHISKNMSRWHLFVTCFTAHTNTHDAQIFYCRTHLPLAPHTLCPCPSGSFSVLAWGNVLPDCGLSGLPSAAWYTRHPFCHGPSLQTSETRTLSLPGGHLLQPGAKHSCHPAKGQHAGWQTKHIHKNFAKIFTGKERHTTCFCIRVYVHMTNDVKSEQGLLWNMQNTV